MPMADYLNFSCQTHTFWKKGKKWSQNMKRVEWKQIVLTSNQLQQLVTFGPLKTSQKQIICRNCSNGCVGSAVNKECRGQSWCMELLCGECEETWFICKLCPDVRIVMKSFKQVRDHGRRYHSNNKTALSVIKERTSHEVRHCVWAKAVGWWLWCGIDGYAREGWYVVENNDHFNPTGRHK